jgi:hypothetical protein
MRRHSIAALVLVLAASPLAFGGTITFTAPSFSLNSEPYVQTGYFNVVVSETGGSDLLNSFQVDLLLPTQNNITFIGADLNTPVAYNPAAYVYTGNDGGTPTPYLATNEAANSDYPITNNVALSPTPLGMMRVEYSIAAGFTGSVALTLNQDNPNTDSNADFVELNSDFTDLFTVSAVNGLIKVTPEPASWVMAAMGAIGLFVIRRVRSRKA